MSTLEEHLARKGAPVEFSEGGHGDPEESWPGIRSDDEANWALRKVAAAETEIARIRAEAQSTIDSVQFWAEMAERGPKHDVEFFTGALVAWRRKLEDANPTLPKTYKLAAGSLVRRAQPSKTVVVDQSEFTAWAATRLPAAIAVRPLVSEIPKSWPHVVDDDAGVGWVIDPETGSPVPGVQVVDQDDKYTVTTIDPTPGPF